MDRYISLAELRKVTSTLGQVWTDISLAELRRVTTTSLGQVWTDIYL